MKKTYKTNHPTIKEISIGDKFVLNNGETIVVVDRINANYKKFRIECIEGVINFYNFKSKYDWWYNMDYLTLQRGDYNYNQSLDIRSQYPIPLKDKINLL